MPRTPAADFATYYGLYASAGTRHLAQGKPFLFDKAGQIIVPEEIASSLRADMTAAAEAALGEKPTPAQRRLISGMLEEANAAVDRAVEVHL